MKLHHHYVMCEVCGNKTSGGGVVRCNMIVCFDCGQKERWCPTVTIYPTHVQAWADQPAEDDVFALPV